MGKRASGQAGNSEKFHIPISCLAADETGLVHFQCRALNGQKQRRVEVPEPWDFGWEVWDEMPLPSTRKFE
jgi:hypothetical protein